MRSMTSCPRPDGQTVNAFLVEPEVGSGLGVVVLQDWRAAWDRTPRSFDRHLG